MFTTDNGTELFTWPDGGQTPFAQSKGTVLEGGFRVPAMIRWPGHVPPLRAKARRRGASFNLDAVKAEMASKMAQAQAAAQGPGR